jgi:hypothetical protein
LFPARKKEKPIVNTSFCQNCGTAEAVELITFTDKDTGKLKRRFKCRPCNKWLAKPL